MNGTSVNITHLEVCFNSQRGSGIDTQYTIYLVRDEGRAEPSTGVEPSHKVGSILPYEEVHVQVSAASTANGEGPGSAGVIRLSWAKSIR